MKQYSLSLIFILLAAFVHAQTTYPSGVTGCIGRWKFSSNGAIPFLNDVSGNNNSGSNVGIVAANGFRNWLHKAGAFNGTSSHSIVPNSSSLSPTEITMIAVVKFNGFYSGNCQNSQILSKGYPFYINGNYGLSTTDNIYDGGNCSNFDPNHQQLVNQFGNPMGSPSSGNYVAANKWYFFAGSYGNNNQKYYQVAMDSNVYYSTISPIYSNVTNVSMGVNNQDISIGRHLNPSYPYWFNGLMDEVVLFNRVLSDAEIQSVYDYLWTVVKLTPPYAPSHMCPKDSFTVAYTTNDTLTNSNVFTVELSDASGSFANPYVLNTVTDSVGGSMLCYLPYNLPNGAGYRYRVVSSLPHFASKDNGFDISVGGPVVNVTVSPNNILPSVQTVTFTATVTNAGAAPLTYQWYVDNMPITGATNATFTTNSYVDLDSFSVRVAAATGFTCNVGYSPYTTMHIDTTISTSVNNTNMTSVHISTAPNPNKGSFTIEGINHNEAAVVEIYTTTGSKVYTQTVSGNSAVSTDLPSGMYLLRVTQASTTTVLKMMIER